MPNYKQVVIQDYTALGSEKVNNYLNGFTKKSDRLNLYANDISEAIRDFPLNKSVHTYRAISNVELEYLQSHTKFNAFKSTGVSLVDVKEFKEDNSSENIVHFYIPKDTRAAYINGNGLLEDEGELLIDKDSFILLEKKQKW